jgi:Holliday junction resolvasome RuvABC DNA-binding subunit
MIARMSGKILEKGTNFILLSAGDITYEVLIPQTVMQRLSESIGDDGTISLITYHYHQVEPSKSTPVLIGFLNEVE